MNHNISIMNTSYFPHKNLLSCNVSSNDPTNSIVDASNPKYVKITQSSCNSSMSDIQQKPLHVYDIKSINKLNLNVAFGNIKISNNDNNECLVIESAQEPTLTGNSLELCTMDSDISLKIPSKLNYKMKLQLVSGAGNITTQDNFKLPYGGNIKVGTGNINICIDQEHVYIEQMKSYNGISINSLQDDDNHENKSPLSLKNRIGGIQVS